VNNLICITSIWLTLGVVRIRPRAIEVSTGKVCC
jgi:hypothetical protein